MKIVIAGGGFGGLRLARKLANRPGFEVVLIDRYNHHQFQPLFYQVATAGIDASNISFPLRKVFHRALNVHIRLAEILRIEPSQNRIVTDAETISYDVLVLALGADTNFFNQAGLQQHAIPMKSSVEALQLRNRILLNFEEALTTAEPGERQRLMNLVVVGGGPTGVELSGALAEMKKYVLPRDFPELDFSKMRICLLEATPRTLGAMSAKSSDQSARYLRKLGVEVMTETLLADYDGQTVTLKDGRSIPSRLVIWAAGIRGNIPGGIEAGLIARGNRIRVGRNCRVPGYDNLFVIGDLAYMETQRHPQGHPQVAQVAMQQADFVRKALKAAVTGKKFDDEFEYRDKGSMATVGRHLAVVDLPKPRLHLGGFLAWAIWMSLHLMLILGVKNRFFVFLHWLYNYITYDQNLRLVFRRKKL